MLQNDLAFIWDKYSHLTYCLYMIEHHSFFISDIEDDHLLNATYYSPELEERHLTEHSSTNLGMIVHNESPTHLDTASSAGAYSMRKTIEKT